MDYIIPVQSYSTGSSWRRTHWNSTSYVEWCNKFCSTCFADVLWQLFQHFPICLGEFLTFCTKIRSQSSLFFHLLQCQNPPSVCLVMKRFIWEWTLRNMMMGIASDLANHTHTNLPWKHSSNHFQQRISYPRFSALFQKIYLTLLLYFLLAGV